MAEADLKLLMQSLPQEHLVALKEFLKMSEVEPANSSDFKEKRQKSATSE